ncbi:MAG: adenylate/guanylate cyclase domain-containing protein [Candidatus Nanopelagicales bacterium]
MVVATLVGVSAGQSLGKAIVDDSLESLRSTASADVGAQLGYYQRLAEQLAGSPQATVAVEEFSVGLAGLSSIPLSDLRLERQGLLDAYQNRYFEPLAERGETVQVRDILTSDPAALYLQAAYSVPEAPITDPIVVSDASDGSDWSATHARFHPGFRTAVTQGGLIDIYLVDASTDRVVYSAAKGPDLGTSLSVGPFGGSIVARAAEAAIKQGAGIVTDLSFYRGHPGTPVGAAAAPVREGDEVVGVVVLTYDAKVYTDRLSAMVQASGRGDSEPGAKDLYLVGADGRTRSDPQTYLTDPDGFLDASVAAGVLPETGRTVIELNGTTALVQPADEATVNDGQNGVTGIATGKGLTGSEVLVTLEELAIDDVEWYSVAEIGAASAGSTVASFRQVLLFGSAVFLVVLAFVAVAWSKSFMRPVRVISDRLGKSAIARETAAQVQPVRIPERSPVEFHRLVDSLTAMGVSLRRQQRELQAARDRRVEVLESMLPAAIAQRIARGDIESLDMVPSASVVVVVVLGLGGLVEADRGGDRGLMDELHAELDGIALEHGLDRVKVVGDSYFGACGHDRPYIDHAPRCVAFAERAAEAVRALSRSSSVPLDTAIGINTGKVTVGMSGGARLVYDVWGPTVSSAHALARTAHGGEIVITQATRARLPEEIGVTRWRDEGSAPEAGPPAGPGVDLWAVVTADLTGQPAPAGTQVQR